MISFSWSRNYLIAAAAALLVSAGSGVSWAFLQNPSQQEREVIRLNYNLKGEFIHQGYSNASLEKPQPNPIYFTKTIESVEAAYSYRLSAEGLAGVEEEVEVRAVISSPGLWEKEVVLLPATQKSGDFTISFPLDVTSLLQLAKDIATDLGVGAPIPEVTVKAMVNAIAQTDKGQIQEQFIQNARVKVGSATLEFVRPFSQSKRGYFNGLSYEQKGNFNYNVRVRNNSLFSNLSMENVNQRSYLPPPPPPTKFLPDPVYFTKAIDGINISYNYSFLTEKPVAKVEEEVEIKAVVGTPKLWDKEIVLIPPTRKEGDFSLTVPLDINSFLDLAKYISIELGGVPAQEITIKAVIHVIAETEKGPLRDEFIQNVKVRMGTGILELVRPFNQRSHGEALGVKYEQRGIFSYSIQTKPVTLYNALSLDDITQRSYIAPAPAKPLPNPVYFTKIIDSVDASFSYAFQTERPVTNVNEEVEVRAIVGSPELWTRDVILVPSTRKEGNFTVAFPMDVNGLMQLAKNIATELGVETPAPEITLKAMVRTVASTEKGPIREEFTQSTRLRNGAITLELLRPLSRTEQGESLGLKYEQRGNFSYAINLKDNKLFGKTVLMPAIEPQSHPLRESANSTAKPSKLQLLRPESEAMPPLWWESTKPIVRTLTPDPDFKPTPAAIKAAPTYVADSLERIDLIFSYEMTSDKPVTRESSEIGVTAYLSAPGVTSQSFVLVPKKNIAGRSATISFPLDIGLFYAMVEAIEKEKPATSLPPSYNLLVRAEVKSTAQSAYRAIGDTLQSDLSIKLDKKSVQWPEVRPATKSGFIKEKTLVPVRRAKIIRLGSLGVLGIVVLAILYGTWHYRRFGIKRISSMEAEARRVKSKHRDIMVDVESLPPIGGEEKVVKLNSLDELIKTSDALLKPVLHEAKSGKHTYCVTDGNTRYLYISEEEREGQT